MDDGRGRNPAEHVRGDCIRIGGHAGGAVDDDRESRREGRAGGRSFQRLQDGRVGRQALVARQDGAIRLRQRHAQANGGGAGVGRDVSANGGNGAAVFDVQAGAGVQGGTIAFQPDRRLHLRCAAEVLLREGGQAQGGFGRSGVGHEQRRGDADAGLHRSVHGHGEALQQDAVGAGRGHEHRIAALAHGHLPVGLAGLRAAAERRLAGFAVDPQRHARNDRAGRQLDQRPRLARGLGCVAEFQRPFQIGAARGRIHAAVQPRLGQRQSADAGGNLLAAERGIEPFGVDQVLSAQALEPRGRHGVVGGSGHAVVRLLRIGGRRRGPAQLSDGERRQIDVFAPPVAFAE